MAYIYLLKPSYCTNYKAALKKKLRNLGWQIEPVNNVLFRLFGYDGFMALVMLSILKYFF